MSFEIPQIRLESLTIGYDSQPLLSNVAGQFMAGSLTAIIGPNGSGKSTLAKAVAGVLAPISGKVTVVGENSGASIGYLPQQAELQRDFPVSVYDVVALGLWQEIGALLPITRTHRATIDQALNDVRMAHLADRQISTLSGGQFQRMLFARLIVQRAPIILLDEPFTAIDQQTTADLLEIIGGWHREGRTVIAVLHNVEMVEALFPTAIILAGGRDSRIVAWGATRDVLHSHDHASLGHGVDAETQRRFSGQLQDQPGGAG